MSNEDELEEVESILHDGVRDGTFELAEENPNHESRYKLSPYGKVKAQETIASKGLPFLVMISAQKALEDGKARTVKSMADEVILKFPNKLKREAKKNFAPFWDEFANYSPQQYLDAYTEAQS